MAKVVPFKKKQKHPAAPGLLSTHDAQRLVRLLAQDSKNVFIIAHGRKRQAKRGISRRQIMTCLQKGVVSEGPFINAHGNLQVNVTRLAAGEEITCVVAIEHETQLIVVTVF